eukprot:scaffold130540_cov67-Attheya_sp.AAC.1
MPDGVIIALTAPAFGAHTQHALIVCVFISAIAIVLTSSPHPMPSIHVETAMVLVVEAPQLLLLCRFMLLVQLATETQSIPSRVCPMTTTSIPVYTVLRDCERNGCSLCYLKSPASTIAINDLPSI